MHSVSKRVIQKSIFIKQEAIDRLTKKAVTTQTNMNPFSKNLVVLGKIIIQRTVLGTIISLIFRLPKLYHQDIVISQGPLQDISQLGEVRSLK